LTILHDYLNKGYKQMRCLEVSVIFMVYMERTVFCWSI